MSLSSRSRSPRPRARRERRPRRSPSISRSRSRSLGRDRRRSGRSRRSPSYSTHSDAGDTRANNYKGRRDSDDRRHSRSRSRSRPRSVKPVNGARQRSLSPDERERRPRKHRSIERYVPGARRRRDTSSSVSSPAEKRQKTAANSSVNEGSRNQLSEPVSQNTTSPEIRTEADKGPEEVGSDSS